MDEASVTALTTAFAPAQFLDIFMDMAPFIVSIVGVLVAVGLITWGVKTVRSRLSRGAA